MPKRTETQKKKRRENERELNQRYKEYLAENPDELQVCRECGKKKKLSQFVSHWRFRRRCLKCHRIKTRKWRCSNHESDRANRERSFRRSADFIRSLKGGCRCQVCGRKFHPCQMDFHHVTEKEATIPQLYEKRKDRVLAEVAKYKLMCTNCHRDETFKTASDHPSRHSPKKAAPVQEEPLAQGSEVKRCAKCEKRKDLKNFTLLQNGRHHSYCKKCMREVNRQAAARRKKKKTPANQAIIDLKSKTSCADCGGKFNHWQMDLDHVTGVKVYNLNRPYTSSVESLLEELSKCEVVCSNCHRLRTFTRREPDRVRKDQGLLDSIRIVRSHDAAASGQFLDAYHYDGYGRPASATYAVEGPEGLIGILKFSPPMRVDVATSIGLKPADVLELDRACLDPEARVRNLMSKAISAAVRLVRKEFPDVRALISFADLGRGHTGSVYRAANWTYVGSSGRSYVYRDVHGETIKKKTVYDRAKSLGLKEREYVEAIGLEKVITLSKLKFVLYLKSK